MFNFDQVIVRQNTQSEKWDDLDRFFGRTDILPLWVADMDFAAPPCVVEALQARAAHPVYGYTMHPESMVDALVGWFARRYDWLIEREWVMMVPGVVTSLYACAQALVENRDNQGIIVQPPVYFPFMGSVTNSDRRLLLNPLRYINGRYEIDFAELELLAPHAKMIFFCSPHNPVGRVWQKAELFKLLRIAKKHNLIIMSDDIHADLILPGFHHQLLATLAVSPDGEDYSEYLATHVITAVAPSKTFNIPGLGLSSLIVPNPVHRRALSKTLASLHVGNFNPFSVVAFEAAYRGGDAWLEALKCYLQQNVSVVRDYLRDFIPQIKLIEPEGTYLLWLDCRALDLNDRELKTFFVQQCKLGLSAGTLFGEGGQGFMRMNIGTQQSQVLLALDAIKNALA